MIYGAGGLLPPLGALGDDDEAGNGQEILALNEKKKREKVLAMANVTVMTTARGSGAEEQSEGRRSPLSLVFYSNVANHNSRCVVMFLVEGGLAWATKVGSRRILVNIGLLTLYLMMTLFGRDFLLCWLT